MDKESRVGRFSRALDQLLDGEQPEAVDDELAVLLEVSRQLKAEAPPDEPDPAFQANLREELVGAQLPRLGRQNGTVAVAATSPLLREWPPQQTGRSTWSRLVRMATLSAALLLLGLVTSLGPLARSGDDRLTHLPSLVGVTSAYAQQTGEEVSPAPVLFEAVSLRYNHPLPATPARVPVYRQRQEPIDDAGARALAERLRLTSANVTEVADADAFLVTGRSGRLVVSKSFGGYFTFEPSSQPEALAPATSQATIAMLALPGVAPVPEVAKAQRIARQYLEERGLLNFPYLVETLGDAPPSALPHYDEVSFVQAADGRPVRGLGIAVRIGDGGEVMAVRSNRAALDPVRAYPILSAAEATRQLQTGHQAAFQFQVRTGDGRATAVASSFHLARWQRSAPTAPPYRLGDEVELHGLLSALAYERKDGRRRYSATLLSGPSDSPTRMQYHLSGPVLADLSAFDQQHVRIWGRVEAIKADPPGGSIRVERFEKLYPEERLVTLLGRLHTEGEPNDRTLVLTADDGVRYAVESPDGTHGWREYQGQWAIVEARTTGQVTKDGYPILTMAGLRTGGEIDQQTDLSRYQQHPRVIPEREPLLSGEATVERTSLEYYATAAALLPPRVRGAELEPFLLVQPIYTVVGRSHEGNSSFEAYVQAVRPEYVEALR